MLIFKSAILDVVHLGVHKISVHDLSDLSDLSDLYDPLIIVLCFCFLAQWKVVLPEENLPNSFSKILPWENYTTKSEKKGINNANQ